jgi:two-component system sensor histidine kinase UhpB
MDQHSIYKKRKIMLSEWLRKITLVFCCSLPVTLFGQHKQIDSLVNILKSAKEDTSKVNTLLYLSRQFFQTRNYGEAKKYASEALTLAEKKNFQNGIKAAYTGVGVCCHQVGYMLYNKGSYSEALKNFLEALKMFERNTNKKRMAWTHGMIGNVYRDVGNYSESIKHSQTAFKLFEETGDKSGVAGVYNNIGLTYEIQGDRDEAMKNYMQAIKIYKELGDKSNLVDRYFNIGFLYEDKGEYLKAIENHKIALEISEELRDSSGIAAAYTNMGEVYYHQALAESNASKKENLLNEALKDQMTALKLYKEIGETSALPVVDNDIGAIYIELGKFLKAKEFSKDGLSISKQLESVSSLKISYEMLAKADSAAGNWQEAFEENKLFILYRDSLLNQETTRKMLKSQLQYDFDKKEDSLRFQQSLTNESLKEQTLLAKQQGQTLLLKEKELALINNEKQMQQLQIEKDKADYAAQKAEADKKQQQLSVLNQEKTIQSLDLKKQKLAKNYLIAGLLLFVVLSFFIYNNYRTRHKLRLQMLRNKIASDLHDDVGSTLSSISIFSQMAQQQSKEVIPMLETIGESSRKMLDAMADIVWTINPENDQFEKIISRMKNFAYELLGAKNIDFEFVADDDVTKFNVPMEVRKNLYLIFKEATNNMVKYAGANKAMFAIKGEKNNLTMMIKDNGKGFDLNKSTEGNGLKNMKKRANEIGAQLVIDSYPGNGTTIQLSVAV